MSAVYVVIPAAGIGTRMQSRSGAVPKQFLLLAGAPILIHTLAAFAAVEQLRGIWVAVRRDEQERLQALLREYAALLPQTLRVEIVEGGETRQASVARGLAATGAGDEDIVLVHDAVRPLVEPAAIDRILAAIERHGAAILGLPATDTIKQVERMQSGAVITSTIPRENIVLAQTPQGARARHLRRAVAEAEADGFAGTDEASLLERAGITVAVALGSPANLKITHPADLPLASWYLEQRNTTSAAPGKDQTHA